MRVNNNIVKYMNTTKLCRYYCTNDKSNKYSSTVLLPKTKFPQQLRGKNVSEQSKNVYQVRTFIVKYKTVNLLLIYNIKFVDSRI